jgi:pectinesterase
MDPNIPKNSKRSFKIIKAQLTLSIYLFLLGFLFTPFLYAQTSSVESMMVVKFPANGAGNVNPDTHLQLTFSGEPILGNAGKIRIYDAADDMPVDSLDLGIPPGPTIPNRDRVPYSPVPYEYVSGNFTNANTKPGTPSGVALPTPDTFQLTIIGGFTDAFHFYPVIIHGNVANIYPHNNLLEYNKTYYVLIDQGVLTLSDNSFSGIKGKTGWTFSTKKTPPPADSKLLVVSGDGSGDFNTVQGAVDFIQDYNTDRVTIFIKNGTYEEIVYFRNKTNITFLGEVRDKVVVCYANNEVFNPHPANIATNEWPGTFPSRRAVFMGDHSSGIHLVNFTIKSINEKPAQAEGLLLMGEQNIVSNVNIEGSGDALQINGPVYLTDSRITGFGDNVLGRGPAFFNNCELISVYGPHMWIRNTAANHGNVFLNCKFSTIGDAETVIARSPANHGISYPYCEAVLINCALEGIKAEGWGPVGGETSNVHYWEYNSTNISDGKPVDVSQRHPASRQLTMEEDSVTIANYSNPAYVLGGWTPKMVPLILSQPEAIKAKTGQAVGFCVKVTAIPEAGFQWFINGRIINGATNSVLSIESVSADDEGTYSVIISNGSGNVKSQNATLMISDTK